MNKPEFYPYVLLPEEIEKIKIEGIPVPEIQELPVYPEKPKKKILGTIILMVCVAVILFIGLTDVIGSKFLANSIIYLSFFIAIVSLTATVFEILQNGKTKKQYNIAIKLYNELKSDLEELKAKKAQAIDNNNSPQAIETYRHDAINKYFRYCYNKIQAVQREHTAAQKRFTVFLEQYFEGKILENIRLLHQPKELDYSPDFVLKMDNPKVNIAIDIEEPYLFDGNKIVIKKNKAEDSFNIRYRVTNELRWVTIVFSEEQIVTHPTEACKLIAHTIDEILLKEKYSPLFENTEKLKRVEIPGQRELSAFIRNKHRENYLTAAGLIDGLDVLPDKPEIKKDDTSLSVKEVEAETKSKDTEKKPVTEKIKEEKLVVKNSQTEEKPEKKKIIDLKATKVQDDKKEKEIITEKTVEGNNEQEVEQLQIVKKVTQRLKDEKIEKGIKEHTEKKEVKEERIVKTEKTADIKSEKDTKLSNKITSVPKKGQLKREADIINKLYAKKSEENEKVDVEKQEQISNEKVKKEPQIREEEKQLEMLEKERVEKEELERKKANQEKLEKEKLVNGNKEKERQEKINLEKEVLEKKKLDEENREKEKANKERVEKERLEKEKLQKELEEEAKVKENNRLMEVHKKQIEVLVSNQEWDQLFDKCNEVITSFPYWDWPYYRKSTVFGNQGKFDEVLEECNKALALNPKLSDAYYNRATAKFFLENYQSAADDYEKCIDLKYENSAGAHFNKGLCYQKMDYQKKAFKEFVKAKELGNEKADSVIEQQYPNG